MNEEIEYAGVTLPDYVNYELACIRNRLDELAAVIAARWAERSKMVHSCLSENSRLLVENRKLKEKLNGGDS